MTREKRIACFEDTVQLYSRPPLEETTRRAAAGSRVYPENFRSTRLYAVNDPAIRVVEGTSFAVARENLSFGRVAVLNFANPHYPGGGVTQGAMAQEECLCRSSNLYACLSHEGVFGDYYRHNRENTDYFFSHRLIYSRDVTVFKDDAELPRLLPAEDWFRVDVITCAAPFLAKRRYTNRAALAELFRDRIRNILEAAIDNEAEVLILGAFGCGAFQNPPEVVAEAFRSVLEEQRYRTAFRRIIFAIKSSVGGDPYTVCPNIAAFQMAFFGASPELEKLRYVGGARREPGTEDARMPGGRIRCRGSESRAYHTWRGKNPYFGKQFSVLGDSICTLEGFNPRGYSLYYTADACEKTGVWEPEDTWWGKVIGFFGGELLVNDAWSGSRVTRPEAREDQFPSACSDRRTGNLHLGSVMPDVILIYLGINDWANGVPLVSESVSLENADTCFALAYSQMLRKLRRNYPQAEILCCTLCETVMASNSRFRFPESFGGIHIRDYNRAIETAARAADCRVLDLYGEHVPYDTVDGTHPTASGMDTLAMLVARQMADGEGAALLDCEQEHDMVDGVCHRCGRHAEPSVPVEEVLRLRMQSTGRTVSISGDRILAGRSRECDFQLDSPYVARSQATFLCRDGQWFLRDNGTKNGTFVNGTRLEPDRLCRLRQGDTISFAGKEEMVLLS